MKANEMGRRVIEASSVDDVEGWSFDTTLIFRFYRIGLHTTHSSGDSHSLAEFRRNRGGRWYHLCGGQSRDDGVGIDRPSSS